MSGQGAAAAPVASPCSRVCRIDEGSGLCAGCGRTLDEIARWTTMGEAGRQRVWAQLSERLAVAARAGRADEPSSGR